MRALWIIIVVLAIAGLAALSPQIADLLKTMGPKKGRIVDHDTGQGIAGALVVAAGQFEAKGAWQSVRFCTYTEMTTTDKDGYYYFPSEYSHWAGASPNADPQLTWTIYASKSGYLPAGTVWPITRDANGNPIVRVDTWLSSQHTTTMRGLEIQIPNIELMQADTSIADRILLFGYTGISRTCPGNNSESAPAMKKEVRKFYRSVEESVCAANADEAIRGSDIQFLPNYAEDPAAAFEAWREIDKKIDGTSTHPISRDYRLADVCTMMKAGDQK